jgi:lambda family phage portal protein
VPASEVLQLSQVRRPGEIRGEPWLTRALMKLHDLDKYDDAQLVKQQIGALFTGFVRGGPQTGNENEILSGQGDANEDGVAIASLEPGLMNLLRADQEITFSDPPKLEDSYESFMEGQERRVAVAAGILFEQLSGNYKHVNDRTWRAAVNEFRRAVEMYQHGLVVFQWAAPVLRRWAETAWLAGKIRLRNGVTLRDVVRVKWAPQAWPYINPTQDVAARRDEVRAGFLSRATHVSERGYAVQTVDEEIAEDNRRADELGLVLDSDPRKVTVAGVAQQPKKDVVDDKPSD